MEPVVIYSTPVCKYCKEAKDFLSELNVPFTDINVAENPEKRKEMIDKTSQLGVPVIEFGEFLLVGFNREKLTERLKEAGYVGN